MSDLWKRFISTSVWSDELLEEVPERFRGIYTAVLPLKYFFFFLFGAVGLVADTAPALTTVTSHLYTFYWTIGVGALALLALIGLARLRPRMELYSTIVLVVLLFSYPFALIILGFAGDPNKLSLGFGLLVFLITPTWRVFDIVRTERRRRG